MTSETLFERSVDEAVLMVESADPETLLVARSWVEQIGRQHGLDGYALTRFVLVVHELVVNAARHGGGRSEVRIWKDATGLRCAVIDQGRGIPRQRLHRERPSETSIRGWGLWLVQQICSDVQVQTSRHGTQIVICYPTEPVVPGPA